MVKNYFLFLKKKAGFTLLEVLLVLGLVAIITSVIWPLSQIAVSQNEFKNVVNTLESDLHQAYTLAREGQNDTSWGVHIENNNITLFAGDSYNALNTNGFNRVDSFSTTISFDGSLYSGGVVDVIFAKLSGVPNIVNNVETIWVKSEQGQYKGFKINKSGAIFAYNPAIYGVTSGSPDYPTGAIFKTNPDGTNYKVIYSFAGSNGEYPSGKILLLNNRIYGTTSSGGSNGSGVVYSLDLTTPESPVYTVLHDFNGSDGSNSNCDLIASSDGSVLYGTTSTGGASNKGVVFSLDISNFANPVFTNLHDFSGTDGWFPLGNLVLVDKKLYGTTQVGGTHASGNIFSLDISNPSNIIYTNLYNFNRNTNDGFYPWGMVQYGSKLFGLTNIGGQYTYGTIYSFDTSNNTYTKLHEFSGGYSDGFYPQWGNLAIFGDKFYGTSSENGGNWSSAANGIIFSFDPSNNTFTDIYHISASDASGFPENLYISGQKIYSNSVNGGPNFTGGIYTFNLANNQFTILSNYKNNGDGSSTGLIVD